MPKPRAILNRRKAVSNIAKITKTMQMIATAKFKRAFDRAVAARPYTDRLTRLIDNLSRAVEGFSHPLLEARPPKKAVVLAIASNRGLCGGYNSGVSRALAGLRASLAQQGVAAEVHVAGKKLVGILKFQKVAVDHAHTEFEDKPTFAEVDALASELLRRYESGDVDAIHVVYTKFLSSARQKPVAEQVLPLVRASKKPGKGAARDYIFSPDAATILAGLLPQSVRLHVFQAFLDASVSEQTARMVAMKSATDNAVDMIKTLTRRYNRSRQSLITTELSEIMGGAVALE